MRMYCNCIHCKFKATSIHLHTRTLGHGATCTLPARGVHGSSSGGSSSSRSSGVVVVVVAVEVAGREGGGG